MMNYVTGFMFTNDRKNLVLITKNNPDWQRGLLNGIGGKIEPGEMPVDAMCREFDEETGVRTTPDQWVPFAVISHRGTYDVHFFVTYDDAANNVATMEQEVVGVYRVDQLPLNVVANLKWLVPLALDQSLRFDTPALFQEKTLPRH